MVLLLPVASSEEAIRAHTFLTPSEEAELAAIRHPTQRREWLACRAAIRQLTEQQGEPYKGLQKDVAGKPHLIGLPWYMSLSHTDGWAAAALHTYSRVGIDVEPIRAQLSRVVPRVLSAAEIAHANGQANRLAMYWCGKESLYKLVGQQGVSLRDHVYIEPFDNDATQLAGHVRVPNQLPETFRIYPYAVEPGLLTVAY